MTILDNFWQFLKTCDIWDTDYNSYNWEPKFMTIFVTWQSRVTLDSIRNSCDVFKVDLLLIPSLSVLFWSELLVVVSRSLQAVNHYCYVAIFSRFMDIVKNFLNHKGWLWKGWLAIATLKPTFTFLVGILPGKSIEYGKIPTKKSESWF